MGLIFFAFFEKFFVPILTSGGYVGLSIATLLSQHHKVIAVDIVPEKVELINNKKSPIQDSYIEKYLAEKELNLSALWTEQCWDSSTSIGKKDQSVIRGFFRNYYISRNIYNSSTFAMGWHKKIV